MDHSGVVIEAQVDWLTVSAHGAERAKALARWAAELVKEEKARKQKPRKWRLMGYEGTHVGAVQYGHRDAESTILRLIGDRASVHLTPTLALADQVTRVDLAVTYRSNPPDPHLGRNVYTMAEMFHSSNPRSALPSQVADANGGYTAYLGRRQSENFLRVYNKEAECRAKNDQDQLDRYMGCWRFELESKGGLASNLARTVDAQTDRASYVQSYLYTYCQQHGIEPPFPFAAA